MRDLSVLITARNEEFLSHTVEDVLSKKRGNTEIIVVCDGNWPSPQLEDHPDVTMIYHNQSIGQRAAINEAARYSKAKFIMKLDAHCIMDEGFDVKLMADCEYDWTVVPRLYNLHVFDWKCKKCGNRTYQGPTPKSCQKCDNTTDFERVMVWKPRWNRKTDFMRFDKELRFGYWGSFKDRTEAQGDIAPTMSLLGACFFMHRKRYWDLGGSEEDWGSWGQQGTEWACKSWLSGGRLVVNKKTWYSHLFRTQGGDFGFPYPQSGKQVDHARQTSRDIFLNNKWPKQKYPLSFLLDKFWPIPGWEEGLAGVKSKTFTPVPAPSDSKSESFSKGIVFYTDNQLNLKIARACQKQLLKIGLPIVSASLKPMTFGRNIHLPFQRGYLTMFKQILAGLEASDADIVFFCEHDVLYHPSHFDFVPPRKDVYYYNVNIWKLRAEDGHAVKVDDCRQTSGLCAYRELLIQHYRERVKRVEEKLLEVGDGEEFRRFIRQMGFEPGTHHRKERVDDFNSEIWNSSFPNVDIRHKGALTPSRWSKDQFRNQQYTKGWTEADEVPGWGVMKL